MSFENLSNRPYSSWTKDELKNTLDDLHNEQEQSDIIEVPEDFYWACMFLINKTQMEAWALGMPTNLMWKGRRLEIANDESNSNQSTG